jgi:hypothetical protein
VPASVLDPRKGAARGLRALVLAVVAVGLAGAAHTFVDGCADLGGLGVALGICWPGAVVVLGRRRRLPALIAWTAGAQVVTHVVVELTCGGAGHATPLRVLAAHATAVLVTAALLQRADSGLWVAHALRRAVGRLLLPRLVPTPVRPRLRAMPVAPLVSRTRWLVSPRVLRGPPSSAPLPTT